MPERGSPPQVPADPLVGRGGELAQLNAALRDAVGGRGRVVVLTGPPGIGKTRLSEELATLAREEGVPVYRIRCTDEPGVPPMWPWLRLLSLAGANGTVAELDESTPTTAAESASSRFRLLDAVATAVLDVGGPTGAVVVLEDLHWADEGTVRILRHLAADVAYYRLLLLVTTRPPRGPIADMLDDVNRHPGVSTVALPALRGADVTDYLSAVLDGALPAQLARAVYERTAGSPLLVRGAATVLREAAHDGIDWDVGASSEVWRRMADGTDVRRLVSTSMAGLDPLTRDILDAAALLDEEIDPTDLVATTGVDAQTVHRSLASAADAHLVTRLPGSAGGYRFSHALVRDAVAAQVTPVEAMAIHRRAAEALDAGAAGDVDRIARAAGHWLLAGIDAETSRRAAESARAAAASASRRFAHAEAAALLKRAEAALQRTGADPATRAACLTELARAQFLSGGIASAVASSRAAFDLASGADRADIAVEAALVVQGIGDVSDAVYRLAEEALRFPGLSAATRARLHARRATTLDALDRFAEVGGASTEAMSLARQSDDDHAVLDAAWARAAALVSPDDLDERIEIGALAVERARRVGQPILEIFGHIWRTDAWYARGDIAAVDREIAEVWTIADGQGLPLARWHAMRLQASRLAFVGDFQDGIQISEEAATLAFRILEDPSTRGLSWAYLSMINMMRGARVRPSAEMFRVLDMAAKSLIIRASIALAALNDDRGDEARAEYDRILARLEDVVPDGRWPGSLNILGHLASEFGDAAGAAKLYRFVLPWTAWTGSIGTATVAQSGSPHREAGRLAATAGVLSEAESHYRRAADVDGGMGARPSVVLDRVGLAEVLERRAAGAAADGGGGQPADSLSEAADLARSAAAEARRLDMPGPLGRADRLLTRLRSVLEARRRDADPLTAREREIAALVARSMSNREIADRLVLSERTVESHVRNILAKLGFTGRTEIVSWSLRR